MTIKIGRKWLWSVVAVPVAFAGVAYAEPWLEQSPSAGTGWSDLPFLGPPERAKPQQREPRNAETRKAIEAKRELQRELHRVPEANRAANPRPTANVFPPPRAPREARTVAPPPEAQPIAPTQAAAPIPVAQPSQARPAQPASPARTAAVRPHDVEQELQRELHRTLPPVAVPPVTEALACGERLAKVARYSPLPDRVGPGACGATGLVRLENVVMPDRTMVALNPAPQITCSMAEQVVAWVREDVGPAATAELGSPLLAISDNDAYDCRPRNNIKGAKLSEHGKGNALDITGIRLRNGGVFTLADQLVAKSFRDKVRLAACGRFMTVLGPGSDAYHGDHVHIDMAERSHKTKLCQWNVRETLIANAQPEQPVPAAASAPPVAAVPAVPPPPKVEAKVEPKIEPKVELKAGPKVERKADPKAEPKLEPKIEAKSEPAAPAIEAKPSTTVETPLPRPKPAAEEASVAAPAAAEPEAQVAAVPQAAPPEAPMAAEPSKAQASKELATQEPAVKEQPAAPVAKDQPAVEQPTKRQATSRQEAISREAAAPRETTAAIKESEQKTSRTETAEAAATQPSEPSPPLPRRKPEALQTLADAQQSETQNRPGARTDRRRHDPARQFERDVRRFMRNFF